MSSNLQRRIKEKLEGQKDQQNLNLNDYIIGDEGCKILGEFLKQNLTFSTLEIKGNNISPKGFAIICAAVKTNLKLKEIIAEWNNIGLSLEGLEALSDLLESNPAISNIDLKNNTIKADGAKVIANILKSSNSNLLSLDLKWNEIGSRGCEYLLEGLQTNRKLKNLDLSCNKVPEELIQEVNRLLARNRKGLPIQPITQPSVQLQQQQQQQQQLASRTESHFYSEQQPQMTMGQLEQNREVERIRAKELKEKCEREIAQEKEIRLALEGNLMKLREEVIKKEASIRELEMSYNNLLTENTLLREEVAIVQRDLSDVQESSSKTLNELQEQLGNNNRDLTGLERTHQHEMDTILGEHEDYVENVMKDWTIRYNGLEERYKQLLMHKEDMEDKINIINENMLREKIEHEDQIRSLKYRISEDEKKKYEASIKQIENKKKLIEGEIEAAQRKNVDQVKEIEFQEQMMTQKIVDAENEIAFYRESINEMHKNLSIYNLSIEKCQKEHLLRDSDIYRLEMESAEMQRALQRLKDSQKEQLDHLIFQHNSERTVWKENSERMHATVLELEKAHRTQEAENAKVKADYDKICNAIQSNINKAIFDTINIYRDQQQQQQY